MAIVDIEIPQMGEGLQEVVILRLLKKPGDFVERDELLYAMETDKADVDVESPWEGTLKEWLAEEGDVLSVGAPIARIETTTAVAPSPPTSAGTARPATPPPGAVSTAVQAASSSGDAAARPRRRCTEVHIPPRSRAYCRKLGISEEEIVRIPAPSGTLMPADIDRYLAVKSESPAEELKPAEAASPAYEDHPLPSRQRVFNMRLKRSAALVVPATMIRPLNWRCFQAAIEALRRSHPGVQSSDFETFAYAVALACRDHPAFRSTLIGKEDTVRRYEHLNLGIAVQRPDDELLMAVVPQADRLDFPDFVATAQRRIQRALEGEDQVNEEVQLHLSYVSAYQITDAIPVLVAPAIAVVFLGAPFASGAEKQANLGVTFDHRLINGVGAANFLSTIVVRIEAFAAEDPDAQPPVAAGSEPSREDSMAGVLRTAEPGQSRAMLESFLGEQVAGMLESSPAHLDPRQPLRALGVDSRLALELTNRLAASLELALHATLLWTYPTLAELASHLAEELGLPTKPAGELDAEKAEELHAETERRGVGAITVLDEIEGLSEGEAEALFEEKTKRSK